MFKKISALLWLILFLLTSCSQYENQALKGNENFKKKFAKEVKSINKDRIAKNKSDTMAVNFETPYEQFYFPQDQNELTFDYYIGSVYFGQPFPARSFPYYENYQPQQGIGTDPQRIFEIAYNSTANKPFQRIGLEFDSINIPVADKYGVPIHDNNKNYAFFQNDSLQKNISDIKQQQNSNQYLVSQKLIAEKKELIYQNQIKEYLKKDQLLEENSFYAIKKNQTISDNRYKKGIYFNHQNSENNQPKEQQSEKTQNEQKQNKEITQTNENKNK